MSQAREWVEAHGGENHIDVDEIIPLVKEGKLTEVCTTVRYQDGCLRYKYGNGSKVEQFNPDLYDLESAYGDDWMDLVFKGIDTIHGLLKPDWFVGGGTTNEEEGYIACEEIDGGMSASDFDKLVSLCYDTNLRHGCVHLDNAGEFGKEIVRDLWWNGVEPTKESLAEENDNWEGWDEDEIEETVEQEQQEYEDATSDLAYCFNYYMDAIVSFDFDDGSSFNFYMDANGVGIDD